RVNLARMVWRPMRSPRPDARDARGRSEPRCGPSGASSRAAIWLSAHVDREGCGHHERLPVPGVGALELQVPAPGQHTDRFLLLARRQRAAGCGLLGERLRSIGDVHRVLLDLADYRILARE